MQKLIDKSKNDKPEKPEKPYEPTIKAGISPPRFRILTVPLKNGTGSPLVVHAFSAKARGTMREAQELGSLGKKRRPKDPKNFDEVYQAARHISRDGWDGVRKPRSVLPFGRGSKFKRKISGEIVER